MIDTWHDREPFADTVAFVFLVIVIWSVISLVNNYEQDNRARIFWGSRGQMLHLALITTTSLSALGALAWIFLSIWWLRALMIVLLAWCIAPWGFRKLPYYLSKTAVGSVVFP